MTVPCAGQVTSYVPPADATDTRHSVVAGRPLVPGEDILNEKNGNFKSWQPVSEIDERDAKFADNWIPRNPGLMRLTGKHPFNAEPPHSDIMVDGKLTPVSMHFVRNHGAVPRLSWESHRVHITGLVDRPVSVSMDDITKLPAVTVTCLLACCSNRRKELNMVKSIQGFNWGPGAASVNSWTGARLSDVLQLAGGAGKEAEFVQFSGPHAELPNGEDGSYGTAVHLSHAHDTSMDVLVAYQQNGQYLHPDHGFPVRMLVPGWTAGRSVKWLTHIHVSADDSRNWYHLHDNKALPSHVDAETAAAEAWWDEPEYMIKELSVNSTIGVPGHDERVRMDRDRPYTLRGYAYSGGGRRITRVELSFDGGATWSRPAQLLPVDGVNPKARRQWAWMHWQLTVGTAQFATAAEVMCRAYDESSNTQPGQLTWNLLGQGNNAVFRLRLHRELDEEGYMCVRFQQPAPIKPGPLGNVGWQEEAAAAAPSSTPPAPAPAAARTARAAPRGPVVDSTQKYVTLEMLEQHAPGGAEGDGKAVWFAHHGKVYDVTEYLQSGDHPGGADSILAVAGEDATDVFDAVHSSVATAQLSQFYIAELAPDGVKVPDVLLYSSGSPRAAGTLAAAAAPRREERAAAQNAVFLGPRWKAVRVMEKSTLSRDVVQLRFALEHGDQALGLPTGKHVLLRTAAGSAVGGGGRGTEEGPAGSTHSGAGGERSPGARAEAVGAARAYTPTTGEDTRGHFDVVLKVYRPTAEHPEGGRVSQALGALAVGDAVEVRGPFGHFHYDRPGHFRTPTRAADVRRVNLLAGGTGITPMWQVIHAVLCQPDDPVQLRLLYACQTEADILLRAELEALAESHPSRLEIHFTIDRLSPGSQWRHSTGYINHEMCRQCLFPSDVDTLALVCGPPAMVKLACVPALTSMGFESGVDLIAL